MGIRALVNGYAGTGGPDLIFMSYRPDGGARSAGAAVPSEAREPGKG